jgi:hypothetical protein
MSQCRIGWTNILVYRGYYYNTLYAHIGGKCEGTLQAVSKKVQDNYKSSSSTDHANQPLLF